LPSFTASPVSISAGQKTTLSWDVSGATEVTIEPGIGSSGSSGSLQLSPAANTTYTLTATNEIGSSTGTVNVTVKPVVTGKADLVITDVWYDGMLRYQIKNQGDAASAGSRSYLYVNDLFGSDSYVPPLAPGEEMIDKFSNYTWRRDPSTLEFTTEGKVEQKAPTTYAKVCADGGNAVNESNKGNNCATLILGSTFTYDFLVEAPLAKWKSSGGDLTWPMTAHETKGAAYRIPLARTLVMCPQQVSNGWILGRFAETYFPLESRTPTTRPFEVPGNAKFSAQVGFGLDFKSTDGVRVALGYTDDIGSVVFFPKMDVYSDGKMQTYEADLSALAGKKTEFILWVEAKDSPEGDCVRWVEPRIIQAP